MNDENSVPDFSSLTPLTKDKLNKFVNCTANGFLGYSHSDWSMGGNASEEKLRRFWNAILLSQTKKTHILADSPDVRGILIASKTADSGTKTLSFLMNGGLKFFSCIPRLLSYESYVGKIRSKHAGKDTWYIFTLAVEKASQGKHVATSLMSPLLSYLDRVGADCYLETHDKKNVPIYEHFGFALVETGTVPHSKLTHYAMLRKPKTSETNTR